MALKLKQKEEYKETELGLLPEDWEVVKLKDVAEKMKAGGTPLRSTKEYWNGDIPFVLIEDMTASRFYLTTTKEKITKSGLDNSSAWIVPPKSILLSMYATIGATVVNEIPVATNQAILAIMPKKNLDAEFGAYVLRYHAERLRTYNIATTQKNVNKGIVENFLIPLPQLQEQRKISSVLSTVQEASQKTELLITSLNELKRSLMKHLFTYGATSFEEADTVKLKDTEIGKIPNSWTVRRINELFEVTSKPRNLRISDEDKVIFIAMEDISDSDKPVKYARKSFSNVSSGVFVSKDDLIISKITPCFENGKQAILSNLPEDYGFATTEVIPLHPKSDQVSSQHLYYYLKIPEVREQLISKMEGTTGRKRLSKNSLLNFSIPLPSLAEQQQISSSLLTIDKKIVSEEQRKQALQELFNSLLKNLMTGKIRVKDLEVPNA